ncbi:olfactory receptor 14I1-like [Tyto alba]|uniref:olfactory receptor 14I1-like n=1 Tax=Tyto alba TaxID=56313 RepID=UPI001C67D427|nr:olfactory receptor 14I1-like [Tyto alba]
MGRPGRVNRSSTTEFLLLVFADRRELQLLHFWLFLGIYLAALLGNGLIFTAVACDHHLHTPMYFFLLNLSLLDLGSISTTVPKAMANSLWNTRDISYLGCAAQVFFIIFFATTELSLLTIMAYDRYVAICKPLHYGTAPSISFPSLDMLVAVLYSVVPPVMNPLIYSMRNKELKDCLRRLMTG